LPHLQACFRAISGMSLAGAGLCDSLKRGPFVSEQAARRESCTLFCTRFTLQSFDFRGLRFATRAATRPRWGAEATRIAGLERALSEVGQGGASACARLPTLCRVAALVPLPEAHALDPVDDDVVAAGVHGGDFLGGALRAPNRPRERVGFVNSVVYDLQGYRAGAQEA
jgi:hypothetical protein